MIAGHVDGARKVFYNQDEERNMTLSMQLKERTKSEHKEAENTPFAKKLAEGTLSKEEYVKYLTALKVIYSQLEEQLAANYQIKALQSFLSDEFKVLYRTEAIEKDLQAFGIKEELPVEGVKEYADHLKEIAQTKPHLLIAHIYIRYMGDLFGGQMIMKKIEPLWPAQVAFYQYASPLDKHPMIFLRKFKQMLDEAPLGAHEIEEVVEEALWAYKQHTIFFSKLDC